MFMFGLFQYVIHLLTQCVWKNYEYKARRWLSTPNTSPPSLIPSRDTTQVQQKDSEQTKNENIKVLKVMGMTQCLVVHFLNLISFLTEKSFSLNL